MVSSSSSRSGRISDFEAEGPGMLGIRVGEIQALDVLSKTEKSEAFQRALVESANRTGKSVATAVTNRVETVKGMPAGVGRFLSCQVPSPTSVEASSGIICSPIANATPKDVDLDGERIRPEGSQKSFDRQKRPGVADLAKAIFAPSGESIRQNSGHSARRSRHRRRACHPRRHDDRHG